MQRAPAIAGLSAIWCAVSATSLAACSIDSHGAVITVATKPVAPCDAYECEAISTALPWSRLNSESSAPFVCTSIMPGAIVEPAGRR